MKKVFLVITIFLTVLVSGIAIGGYSYYNNFINQKEKYNKILEISGDKSLRTSLSPLRFSEKLPFRYYLKYEKNGGKAIKAGYYEIRGEYSIKEIVELLESGKSKVARLTIPEGYSLKNILNLLSKGDKRVEEEFVQELKKIEFPYPTPNGNFEGYFYPETYFIPENYSKAQTLNVFLREFLKKFPPEKYPDKNDFYQKLIMASIIEREAILPEEKPIIASVFYNRLMKGMTLSSDATVNYLYDYGKKRMYYKDLEIDSPYNTYKYRGLPPGPIANPDKNSLDAAFNPDNTEYLFFVAKGDKSHFFSRTYKEHLEFQRNNKK
ncbi:MAG: endolytic transglycosylase MltG [Fusobacteriaceae bacterium]